MNSHWLVFVFSVQPVCVGFLARTCRGFIIPLPTSVSLTGSKGNFLIGIWTFIKTYSQRDGWKK